MNKLELIAYGISKSIKDKIIAPIPESIIQERDAGRGTTLSYLSGSTVTDMLNDIFNYNWDWKVEQQWIEKSVPFFNQYAKVKDSEKVLNTANGKMGVWENQAPVAHVKGILTVRFMQKITHENGNEEYIERSISKTGFGSKSIIGKQSEQESIFKAAGTDALKKAASLLGIGLELYRNEEQMDYFNELNYEDPWTDEKKEEKKEQLKWLKQYREECDVSQEQLIAYINEITESNDGLTPDNIDYLIECLQQTGEEEEEKEE